MSKNKEIQEQRMRQYFIDATREILKGEGLKAVNVRAVSERAGYSFATLYNYFKDLNELIFICVQGFMTECEAMIDGEYSGLEPGIARIKKRMEIFIRYFTQYPDIFELFYIERMNDIGARQPTSNMIYLFTDKIIEEDVGNLIKNQTISKSQAENLSLTLKNSIIGMLLFYNNRLQPTDYNDFLKIADQQIDICLGI
ncbi:MAG: TetR/AcrR family transcriptional regulator [Lentimicrobium sp.]|jgi:AcrR family transcriptional regulator|nr:TetR/AcrR family transcriptional regulator [Lentimicrobium sp.]